jgi:hypothetical protein
MSIGSIAKLVTPWLVLMVSTAALVASPSPCKEGKAFGEWQRPNVCSDSGYLFGKLADGQGQGILLVEAKLIETPSPCLSCQQGKLDGVIRDPDTGAVLYRVAGEWSGLWFSGEGQFEALILSIPPTPSPPIVVVGKLAGKYSDPGFECPGDPLGKFEAEWAICR